MDSRSIAVLFPGPSLDRVWDDGMGRDWDEVVSVNVACRKYEGEAVLEYWRWLG